MTFPSTSTIEVQTGNTIETHDLVTYRSLGRTRGLTLRYTSASADPRPILHFRQTGSFSGTQLLIAKMLIFRGMFQYNVPGYIGSQYGLTGSENFWAVPMPNSGAVDGVLQVDLRNQPSGQYSYRINYDVQPFNQAAPQFSPLANQKVGSFSHINRITSAFGAGWALVGWPELINNPDGTLLLLDGDGSQLLFYPPTTFGNPYQSPADDFSRLVQANDLTVTRTFKNRTVYTFTFQQERYRLATVRDRVGNETRYDYDPSGKLIQIVDPVGLMTKFEYNADNRVFKITHPGSRTTLLEYSNGNLTKITHPDGAVYGYGYDAQRRMITSTDARNNREGTTNPGQTSYNYAGRVISSTRKDGSTVAVQSVVMLGLYPPNQTIDPLAAPVAYSPGNATEAVTPTATSTDGNNSTTTLQLNQKGGVVSGSVSAVGANPLPLPSQAYNAQNLVSQVTNARGQATNYTYDSQGNLTQITDSLTVPDPSNPSQRGRRYTYESTFNQVTEMIDELGRRTRYAYDTNNGNLLTQNQAGLTAGDSDDRVTTYAYTSAPNTSVPNVINTIRDPLGRITTFYYNAQGLVTRVTHKPTSGATEQTLQTFTYDTAGNVLTAADALGQQTTFTYDAFNRLTQVQQPDPDGTGPLTRPTTQYGYDLNGNLVRVQNPLGNVRNFEYDALNRLTRKLQPDPDGTGPQTRPTTSFNYDAGGRLTRMTDPLGRVTDYEYDSRDRLVRTTYPDPDGTGPLTRPTVQYGYDADDNQISVTDPLSNLTAYAYDARNRQTSQTDALSRVTRYDYDAVNNLIRETAPLNTATNYTYDVFNRVIREAKPLSQTTDYAYDAVDNLLRVTDALNRVTSFAYDSRNRQISQTDALNRVTQLAYDAVGNLISLTDPLTNVTRYAYDALNRLTQTTQPDPDGTGSQTSPITRYAYDGMDNLVSLTDPLSQVTRYAYDALDRLVQVTQPDPDGSGPLASPITRYTYDAVGNLLTLTDPLNNVTRYAYDGLNRLSSQTDARNLVTRYSYDARDRLVSETDPLNNVTRYTYDAVDNRLSITDPLSQVTQLTYDAADNLLSLTDSLGNPTRYTYDALNQLTVETIQLTGGANPTTASRRYEYDRVGNLTKLTDRNGRVRTFGYDTLNRRTTENWLNSTGGVIQTITATYDAAGRLTNLADPNATYAHTYDALNRVTVVDNTGTPGIPATRLASTYNGVNNRLSLQETIANQVRGLTNFAYDGIGWLVSVSQSGTGIASKRAIFGNDPRGQITRISRYASTSTTSPLVETTLSYGATGLTTQIQHRMGTTLLSDNAWTHDAAERVTGFTNPDGSGTYSYDNTDQLTGADYSFQTDEAYSYDANGNRTNSGYVTGTNNRLTGDGSYTYTYDNEGNRIQRSRTGEITTYTWDHRNRLTQVETRTGVGGAVIRSAAYTYDAFDRRISRTIDSDGAGPGAAVIRRFVYDRDHIWLVFDTNNAVTHRYLYGPAIDMVLAEELSATDVRWPLTDNQGTLRDMTNNAGAVQNHLQYNSFGRITGNSNPSFSSRFAYTGREFDSETGLYYYRSRYYDPAIGRFLSEDAIGFAGGDPNLYRYVGNSPVNAVDPLGTVCIPQIPKSNPAASSGKSPWTPRSSNNDEKQRLDAIDLVKKYRLYICQVAMEYNVTPDAIAGVILWEALENPYVPCDIRMFADSDIPGKIHPYGRKGYDFFEKQEAEKVEK